MKTRKLLAILLALVMVLSLFPATALADTAEETVWTVENTTGSTFRIERSGNTSSAVTVRYRTVSLSAVAGENFTETVGQLTFQANETWKDITVPENEISSVPLRSLYQTTDSRSYRFEVLDIGGFELASTVRSISYG